MISLALCSACGSATKPAQTPAPDLDYGVPNPTPYQPGVVSQVPTPLVAGPYGFVGRFQLTTPADANDNRFAWSGSAVGTRFRGTQLTVEVEDVAQGWVNGVAVNNRFDVLLDNLPAQTLTMQPGASHYTVATNLSAGEHTVWLRKRTEAKVGAARFFAFDPGDDGVLLGPPPASGRRIEFVGFAPECGFGDEASITGNASCSFTPDNENAGVAYPALVARTFAADATNITYSYPEADGLDMTALYSRIDPGDANAPWTFSTWVPQAVVIAASGAAPQFTAKLTQFLQTVRQNYPQTQLFVVLGPLEHDPTRGTLRQALQSAVQQEQTSGDSRTTFVELTEYTGPSWGCGGMPDMALHVQMANELAAAMSPQLHW